MNEIQSAKRRRVVVLGAGGFLGSSMTRHLAEKGHEVIAFWRQPRPDIEKLANVTSIVGDIRDTWTLAKAIRDSDVVYHFASSTYPSLFYADPTAEYCEALQPLLLLMEIARQHGVRKIVYPSSGGTVYADSSSPRSEESPTDPRSPYAIFKLAAEHLLHHAARQNQFFVDVYRIANPYGPGQCARPGQGVLPHWFTALHNGEAIRIFGDGSAERDYIYIEDICRLMAASCDQIDESRTFNLGTGQATSLSQLAKIIRELTDKTCEIEFVPSRPSDVASISLSPNRILSSMPNFEFVSLRQGLERTLQYHRLLAIE